MAEFVVELYVALMDGAGAGRGPERARLAAEELTGQGTPVRYLRAILVPEDEACLRLYDAASADAVRAAARRAVLPFEPSPRRSPSRADHRADTRDPSGFRAGLPAGRRLREEGQQR